MRCPAVSDVDAFVAWLEDFGRRQTRPHVLFPASDELAWVFAVHEEALSRGFVRYGPSRDSITRILDKWRLTEACRKVGVETPETWCPEGTAEVDALARELKAAVMIKPRSQVLLTSGSKGTQVDRPADLPAEYRRYLAENPPLDALSQRDPLLGRPIVQEFRPEAANGIYNLAGFIDRTGEHVVMRASRKILQRPRRLGIGLCFESAPLHAALADGVMRLCRELGYFGIFEIEMIESDGRFLLIDFNPRPYSQMAFEIARGVPLPYLAYLDATGRTRRARARRCSPRRGGAGRRARDRVRAHTAPVARHRRANDEATVRRGARRAVARLAQAKPPRGRGLGAEGPCSGRPRRAGLARRAAR